MMQTRVSAYLQYLQAKAYAAVGKRLVSDWRAEYEGLMPRILAEMTAHDPENGAKMREALQKRIDESFSRPLPTPYEDPMGYEIVLSLIEEVETAATRIGKSLPFRPLIGTLPYESVNAMSISLGKDGYIIAFQDEVFNFANLFAKAVALALPFEGNDGDRVKFSVDPEVITQSLTSDSMPVQRFSELILAYMLDGKPGAAPPYILGHPHGAVAAILRRGMETFVMAHEYGHITSGHLEQAPSFSDQEKEMIWNWKQEAEADARGLELTLSVFSEGGYDLPISYWASDLALLSFDVVERALAVARGGDEAGEVELSATHPPAAVRRELLRDLLERSVPEAMYASALKLRQNSELIVDALWSHTRERLRTAIDQGAELAPMWKMKLSTETPPTSRPA